MIFIYIILGLFAIHFLMLGFCKGYPGEPNCKRCSDMGQIEVNIWFDEVAVVDCPNCRKADSP
jgi:hypothetical protein